MVPTLVTALLLSEDGDFTQFAAGHNQMDQITFDRSDNSWQQPATLKQTKYSQLRVAIPSSNSIVMSDASSPSADTCSSPSTPESQSFYRGAFVGGLLTGRLDAAEEAAQQQLHNLGPLSSGSAARRLLACDCSDREGVSNWLDQQISMRESARAAVRSFSASAANMEMTVKEVPAGAGAASSCSSRVGLPPPAFQLLGLL